MVRTPSLTERVTLRAGLKMLRAIGQRFTSTELPEWETFARAVTIVTYPRRVEVVHGAHDLSFIVRGAVKLVNTTPEHAGRVEEFFTSGSFIGPALRPSWAVASRPPLSLSRWRGDRWSIPPTTAHTLDSTTLLRLDYRVVERLAARHAAWGQVHAAFLWSYIDSIYCTSQTALNKDVAERYQEFRARRRLADKATQREIASYLNVTESALSRIIHRLDSTEPQENAEASS